MDAEGLGDLFDRTALSDKAQGKSGFLDIELCGPAEPDAALHGGDSARASALADKLARQDRGQEAPALNLQAAALADHREAVPDRVLAPVRAVEALTAKAGYCIADG